MPACAGMTIQQPFRALFAGHPVAYIDLIALIKKARTKRAFFSLVRVLF
jgi:hypothetical protein